MTTIALGIPMRRRDPAERPPTLGRPDDDGLVDRFGRVAHDLRVSITERCSLRCTYCMPEEGLPVIPTDQLLTAPEIARLVGIAARDLDVREVRFTGGEPLTRGDLVEIIGLSAAAAPGLPLAMTTNAIGLDKKAAALKAAGLGRLNVSLDTIDRKHFAELTRRDRLPAVIRGVEKAQEIGLGPIKLNAVLMRETLDDAPALLKWAVERGLKLRFIEQMPLDADETWRRDQMVPAAELIDVLGASFSLEPAPREDPSAPAELWTVDGGPATVGIIASVTRSFCADCDRTRLTAEGSIRSCLFGDDETDLRGLLRGGVSDAELADRWRAAMWGKQAGHGIDSATFSRPIRSMGAIGG